MKRPWLVLSSLAAVAGCSLSDAAQDTGGNESPAHETPHESLGRTQQADGLRPARLYLTQPVLDRLKQRAAANDPGWTALKAKCDAMNGGTMNPPNVNLYPDFPSIGQGYQGEDYLNPIYNISLCYRVAAGVDDTAAGKYGDTTDRLLVAMSTPPGSGGEMPSQDDGYGIRNYGTGMATAFDWAYPALSAGTIARVVTSLNLWIDYYDKSGFSKDQPIGNYFAGYVLAKTTTAIATDGDNPKAAGYWSDVETRMWGTLVKPQFTTSMAGGGWPEGWGYGPLAVDNFAQFFWAVKTGKNLDWGKDVPFWRDESLYITNFAWPSNEHMDDQGTIHSSSAPLRPPPHTAATVAMILEYSGDSAGAALGRGFASDLIAKYPDRLAEWQGFLLWDASLPKTAYTTLPLSYFAPGPGHVAMRSAWAKDAVWGAFVSGPYINADESGEEYFNEGSLTVVQGDQPVLVNPGGWLPQTVGDPAEDFIYAENYDNETRRIYNTFFVDDANNPTNPGQVAQDPTVSKTHVERYDEQVGYTRMRGANIEDMYIGKDGDSPRPINQFMRDVVYVRPNVFVVLDHTNVAKADADQWTAWHTPTAPAKGAVTDSSQVRYDISAGGAMIGSVRSLLPKAVNDKVVPVLGDVNRIEFHNPTPGADQDWLSVVTVGATVPDQVRLSTDDGNVQSGDIVGVHVLATPHNQVVLFPTDHKGAGQTTAAKFVLKPTNPTDVILVDMARTAQGYGATATVSGGSVTVEVKQGGTFTVSPSGSVSFSVTPDGKVTQASWPQPAETAAGDGTDPAGQAAAAAAAAAQKEQADKLANVNNSGCACSEVPSRAPAPAIAAAALLGLALVSRGRRPRA